MEMILLDRLEKRLREAPEFESEEQRVEAGRQAYVEADRDMRAIKVAQGDIWPHWVALMEARAAMGHRSITVEIPGTSQQVDAYWAVLSGLAKRHMIQAQPIPDSQGRVVELSW